MCHLYESVPTILATVKSCWALRLMQRERAAIICDYSMLEGVGTLVCLILKINENQFRMNRNKKAVI